MSIVHRPFSAGFGTYHHTTRTPKAHYWGWGRTEKTESGTPERQGSTTSYPWEGLYLEVDETRIGQRSSPSAKYPH